VTPSPEEQPRRTVTELCERISYLSWALERHRSPHNTRGDVWRRVESEYESQLQRARQELADIEQS
jgi:hypothetical protein